MSELTATERIERKAFELLEHNPEGIRWVNLSREIEALNPDLHPKTVNGIIWKMPEKYPEKVYKPSRGVFRLIKE